MTFSTGYFFLIEGKGWFEMQDWNDHELCGNVYFMHGRKFSSLNTWARTRVFKLVTYLCQTIELSC